MELYRYLALSNPAAVVTLENPHYLGVKDFSVFTSDPKFQDLFSRVLNAKQQIIVLAINHPINIPESTEKPDHVLKPVFESLAQKYSIEGVKKMLGPTQLTVLQPKWRISLLISIPPFSMKALKKPPPCYAHWGKGNNWPINGR